MASVTAPRGGGRGLSLLPRRRFAAWADRLAHLLTLRRLRATGAAFGEGLTIRGRPYILNEGRLVLGDGVRLRSNPASVRLRTTRSGMIRIGRNTSLNTGVTLFSDASIEIGEDTRIGDYCALFDTSFHAVHEGQHARARPIRIGRNVWLARNVTVMPGVTIGDHSVVSAGAVVFDDIPARQLWRGNPATFCKHVRASDLFRRS